MIIFAAIFRYSPSSVEGTNFGFLSNVTNWIVANNTFPKLWKFELLSSPVIVMTLDETLLFIDLMPVSPKRTDIVKSKNKRVATALKGLSP